MKTSVLSHLTTNEEMAIAAYITQIHHNFAGHIRAITLFGSKARGDADIESDIDLLVLVAVETNQLRAELWRIAADIGLVYNVVLSVRVVGQARWDELARLRLPLYRSIVAEGIPLNRKSLIISKR
jgi:predicted nucleotidyltransferase